MSKDKEKQPGELNIVGLFEAEATSLLQAVERGLLLHKTKNIRDSGALVESRFRDIISSRLPPHTQLAHGYLFDVDSRCTPQVDAMLLSAEDNHPMLAGEGGAIYAPFTCCKAYVEIKSKVANPSKQLTQTAEIAKHLSDMRLALLSSQPDRFRLEEVASVLFFANSVNAQIEDFSSWYSGASKHPTVVVFLDQGVVIARRPVIYELTEMYNVETLEFQQLFSGKTPWLYQPDAGTVLERRGKVLLWLYYFLLYCSTRRQLQSAPRDDGGSSSEIPPVTAFIQAANRRLPLVPLKELSTATGRINEL